MIRALVLLLVFWAGAATAVPPDEVDPSNRAESAASPQPPAIRRAEQPGRVASRNPLLRPLARMFSRRPAIARQNKVVRGALCGRPSLRGERAGRVPGRISGCGIEDAVRITEVEGVALSQPALMDCRTAKALGDWIRKGAAPAFEERGGGLVKLRVAAHYACRTRNNQKGARISEHGLGRAIDISAFTLADGTTVTVLDNWDRGGLGQALKKTHAEACGPFGTVLGPEADKFHRDHFHFDTARYRNGAYCH